MPSKNYPYPYSNYRFSVEIGTEKVSFQSVQGLSATLETEDFSLAGESRFIYKLPKHTTYTNLVLKRGLIESKDLINWCTNAFELKKIELKNLTVSLLDPTQNDGILMSWAITNAYPKKWSVSDFDANSNSYAVETLELQYQYFKIV